MQTKRTSRFEIDNKFFAVVQDGFIIGKTASGRTHLTTLFKDGRMTIHGTQTLGGLKHHTHLYSAETARADWEEKLFKQALNETLKRLSTLRLPKKIWALPNELLIPRLKHENKRRTQWKTTSFREFCQKAILMDSHTFAEGKWIMGRTTRGTMIMRTKYGSFLLWNKKTRRTLERLFRTNSFLAALEKGRKFLKRR